MEQDAYIALHAEQVAVSPSLSSADGQGGHSDKLAGTRHYVQGAAHCSTFTSFSTAAAVGACTTHTLFMAVGRWCRLGLCIKQTKEQIFCQKNPMEGLCLAYVL